MSSLRSQVKQMFQEGVQGPPLANPVGRPSNRITERQPVDVTMWQSGVTLTRLLSVDGKGENLIGMNSRERG